MSIDTLANVKLHLGITTSADDALLTQLQAAADAFIEEHCSRTFGGGSFTEDHPGGGRAVFLRNFPVSAVTSVKVDTARGFGAETTLDASDYILHADRGVIESIDGPFVPSHTSANDFPGAVRVAYATPSSQVPAALSRAYAELIGHWYREAKTAVATGQQNLLQQTSGSTVTQYPWGQSGGFQLPAGVLQLLEPYRVPNL